MSELKVYHHELRHNEYEEFYLKYEADKEIAELKEIDSKNRSAYYKDLSMMAKDVERHKYKRCLAMAKLCRSVWAAAIFIPEKGGTDKQAELYMKWEKCWLSLADKFKDKEA